MYPLVCFLGEGEPLGPKGTSGVVSARIRTIELDLFFVLSFAAPAICCSFLLIEKQV